MSTKANTSVFLRSIPNGAKRPLPIQAIANLTVIGNFGDQALDSSIDDLLSPRQQSGIFTITGKDLKVVEQGDTVIGTTEFEWL